jgi:hypothetical protein
VALILLLPLNVTVIFLEVEPMWMFQLLGLLQILFYLSAIIGYNLAQRALKNKILFLPYYFLFMNLNVFKGFTYLRNFKGNAAWEKASRRELINTK